MSWVQTLFTANPMNVEIQRFKRKYLRSRLPLTLIILGMYFFGVIWFASLARASAAPVLLYFAFFLVTVGAPAIGYNAIAGERERRSWDLLAVAPVTHAQIVIGKFLGMLFGLVSLIGLMGIPAIFCSFLPPIRYYDYDYGPGYESQADSVFWPLMGGFLVVLCWGILQVALTIFFSARCKRGLVAFGIVVALNFAGLILIPALFASAFGSDESKILLVLHPGIAIQEALELRSVEGLIISHSARGIMCSLTYLGLAAIFLYWTEKTLRFADGDVKFVGHKKNA